MALNKGRIAIPLSKGINQKIDPKQEPPGSLKVLENIQVDKYGEIEKQDGYEKTEDSYGYVSTLTTTKFEELYGLTSLKDELYAFTSTYAAAETASLGKLLYQGKYLPSFLKTNFVGQNSNVHTNNEVLLVNNMLFSVHVERTSTAITAGSSSITYLSARDVNSDANWFTRQSIFQTGYGKPKIVYLKGYVFIFAVNLSTDVIHYKFSKFDNFNDLTAGVFYSLGVTLSTNKVFDIVTNQSNDLILLGYQDSSNVIEYNSYYIQDDPVNGSISLTFGLQYTVTGPGPAVAIDLHGIMQSPRKEGVRTTSLAENGFLANVVFQKSTNNSYEIYTNVFNHDFSETLINNDYFLPASSTANESPKAPVAITGVSVDNNVKDSTRDSIRYQLYVQSNLDGTFTSTGIGFDGRIDYIDNTTGTRAAATLDSTDFGSTGYMASGSDGTNWTTVDLADLPSCYKTRIDGVEISASPTFGTTYVDTGYSKEVLGCSLFTKAFSINGNGVLPVARKGGSGLQDSYYLLSPTNFQDSEAGQPIGLIGYGNSQVDFDYSSNVYGYSSVPNITKKGDNQVFIPTFRKSKILSNDDTFFTIANASITELNYKAEIANQSEEMSNNIFVAGSLLFAGDQQRFMEQGFTYNPDRIYVNTESMTKSTSHKFANGDTYNYIAIFKYEDAQGNIYRSGLSSQLTFEVPTVGASTGFDEIDLMIPLQNITGKYAYAIEVEVYRTTAGGTLFYKVSGEDLTLNNPFLQNNKSYFFIKFRDDDADSTIQDNELLYTTGGVLETTPIGSCSMLESFKNRIFMGGVENDPNRLYFSKLSNRAEPPEFNNTLVVDVPPSGGDIVAIKKMDDKLIIFKKNAIYFLTGEGPNNLGEQNDFIEPQLISNDLGCKFGNSVAFMPKGLMFMSQKGIYLLNRSLGLDYIGAPAEDYNHLTITKANTVSKKDEVRFLTSDGPTVIYNYFLDMWYTSGVTRGLSATVIGDDYYLATFKDEIFKQVNTTATFGGSMVPIKLETGWLSFAGIQGFQRVYRMLLLGEYKSPHKLKIKIAYDYDDVWKQEKVIDVTSYTESYRYGGPKQYLGNELYGDPDGSNAIAYGGKDNTQYQIRLNFGKQKCEAIKIQIEEVEGSNPAYSAAQKTDPESGGPGFTLSNLSFIVGTKDGDFRLKQARTFGSTSIT